MKPDNPFCNNCKEADCVIDMDGTCAMIRVYLKSKQDKKADQIPRPNSVSCSATDCTMVKGFIDLRKGCRNALFPFWKSNMCVGDDEIIDAIERCVKKAMDGESHNKELRGAGTLPSQMTS